MIGRREDQRARLQHLVRRLGRSRRDLLLEFFPIDRALGHSLVTGRFDELGKFSIGHRRGVHPKAIDVDPMGRAFVRHRFFIVGSHDELATWDPDHVGRIGRAHEWRHQAEHDS